MTGNKSIRIRYRVDAGLYNATHESDWMEVVPEDFGADTWEELGGIDGIRDACSEDLDVFVWDHIAAYIDIEPVAEEDSDE